MKGKPSRGVKQVRTFGTDVSEPRIGDRSTFGSRKRAGVIKSQRDVGPGWVQLAKIHLDVEFVHSILNELQRGLSIRTLDTRNGKRAVHLEYGGLSLLQSFESYDCLCF